MCTLWNSVERKSKREFSIKVETKLEDFWSKNWCKKWKSSYIEQISHDNKLYRETQTTNAFIIHLKPNIEHNNQIFIYFKIQNNSSEKIRPKFSLSLS